MPRVCCCRTGCIVAPVRRPAPVPESPGGLAAARPKPYCRPVPFGNIPQEVAPRRTRAAARRAPKLSIRPAVAASRQRPSCHSQRENPDRAVSTDDLGVERKTGQASTNPACPAARPARAARSTYSGGRASRRPQLRGERREQILIAQLMRDERTAAEGTHGVDESRQRPDCCRPQHTVAHDPDTDQTAGHSARCSALALSSKSIAENGNTSGRSGVSAAPITWDSAVPAVHWGAAGAQ